MNWTGLNGRQPSASTCSNHIILYVVNSLDICVHTYDFCHHKNLVESIDASNILLSKAS